MRETCAHSTECATDACSPSTCQKYGTDLTVKFDSRLKVIVRCNVTGKELTFPFLDEIDPVQAASELNVRPKDVFMAKMRVLHLAQAPQKETEQPEIMDPTAYFDEQNGFVPKLLAEDIMHHFCLVTMIDNEQIYAYEDGCYKPIGEVLIRKECKKRLEDRYRKNRAAEVIDFIKASTYTKRREEPPDLIPVQNGILDMNIMVLKPYEPTFMFFNKIPVNYDLNVDCPEILKFLKEVTSSEQDVKIIEEILGFCLWRIYFLAKAVLLVGGGANGKSTFLALVKAFLGAENISSRNLQELEENRFAKADLHSKLANIYADLPNKALLRTGTFKMLTGKDPISAEHKFQNSFQYENYAKLLFSANKVPEAYDDTDAFFRRWIILVFPNVFSGEKADPHILKKLTSEKELSGLLNLALNGLKRLLDKGNFSYSKTTSEIKEDYIRKSSPIAAFVMDCLEADPDAFVVKKELYNVFTEYCRQKVIPTVTQDTFFKNLAQHVAVTDFRPKIQKDRLYTFKGIRYGLGVSSLSNVSKLFYTLATRSPDFSGFEYKVEKVSDTELIKIRITLDRMDTIDIQRDNNSSPIKDSPILTIENIEHVLSAVGKEATDEGTVSKIAVLDYCELTYGMPRDLTGRIILQLIKEEKLVEEGRERVRRV